MKKVKQYQGKDCQGRCPYCGSEGNKVDSEDFYDGIVLKFKLYGKEYKCQNCCNEYKEVFLPYRGKENVIEGALEASYYYDETEFVVYVDYLDAVIGCLREFCQFDEES